MLKQVFVFEYQKCSGYLTYQHEKNGFGENCSFTLVHGDIDTEYCNHETKGNTGPFRMEFSTDLWSYFKTVTMRR